MIVRGNDDANGAVRSWPLTRKTDAGLLQFSTHGCSDDSVDARNIARELREGDYNGSQTFGAAPCNGQARHKDQGQEEHEEPRCEGVGFTGPDWRGPSR